MTTQDTMDPKAEGLGEDSMVSKARWEEIRRLAAAGETVSAIGRQMDLDRKTVRALVHKTMWEPYRRAPKDVQRLTAHAAFLRERAPAVDYSAQILYQELCQQHAYTGSYATVRRFVRPLREAACRADLTWTRFETAPGQQSQIDWGQARVVFGTQPVVRHIFVLTLGFSRRSVYVPYLDEALGSFLDAHETAFEHFGGHTQEHLYDRARTVCHPLTEGGSRWKSCAASPQPRRRRRTSCAAGWQWCAPPLEISARPRRHAMPPPAGRARDRSGHAPRRGGHAQDR